METGETNDVEAGEHISHEAHLPPVTLQAGEYLSVREAAGMMGVSTRSVYGYIGTGRLLGIRIGSSIAVHAEAVRKYQRSVVGRPRTRTPIWRVPVVMNLQYLTTINVRVREGQSELLGRRLTEIRMDQRHLMPGTVARYIVRNQANPDDIQIILIWRKLAMPSDEERETTIAALCNDLADILDWETALRSDGQVILNA